MNQFYSIITKEITLAARSGYESFFPILYLFIIIIFFNISISYAGKNIILELIPLMIWIACLLICVLNIESIFKDEYDDGSLEIFVIHNENLEIDILAKIFSHWLLSNFPVVLIAPFLSLLLGLDYDTSIVLFLTLLIGTPTMSLLGSIAAALTISLKKNKILTSIVVLPLYIPILIFGTSAVSQSQFNLPIEGQLYFLGSVLILSLITSPFVSALALRISLE